VLLGVDKDIECNQHREAVEGSGQTEEGVIAHTPVSNRGTEKGRVTGKRRR